MGLVKYNNLSISSIDDVSKIDGAMVLIKSQTASSSSTISFVDGTSDVVLDNTYPIYLFKFINCHPSGDDVKLTFNLSADTGSNYNVTKTTTAFTANHAEADTSTELTYNTSADIAQGTGFQRVAGSSGNDNDQCTTGELWLFNPSSTTFVKHFMIRSSNYEASNYAEDYLIAGYGNTTSAIDAVQFKYASGNIDAGTIKLYGIKDS